MKIDEFIRKHPPREPRIRPRHLDEARMLTPEDGVMVLTSAPADAQEKKTPARKGDPGCHLWVIGEQGLPYLLERAEIAQSLATGVVKHTNLTGGGEAAAGGELWVDPVDSARLYVNGCSGRYGPTTRDEL
jgi:hypothetical protein